MTGALAALAAADDEQKRDYAIYLCQSYMEVSITEGASKWKQKLMGPKGESQSKTYDDWGYPMTLDTSICQPYL